MTPAEELAEARETIKRLNRRCSQYEQGLASKVDEAKTAGPSFGRSLANAAATMYEAERDAARAERDEARKALSKLVATYTFGYAGGPMPEHVAASIIGGIPLEVRDDVPAGEVHVEQNGLVVARIADLTAGSEQESVREAKAKELDEIDMGSSR